jgi:hypothetical protein
MTENKATAIWREIKPFAIRDMNDMLRSSKSSNGEQGVVYAIILFDLSNQVYSLYSTGSDGMTAAINAAQIGDIIYIPAVELSGDYSIPPGVTIVGESCRRSILTGQIILGDECQLETLKVLHSVNSDDPIFGVIGPTGIARIIDCEIHCYSCGAGTAVGIEVLSGTIIYVDKSVIVGDSKTGLGYAFSNAGGTAEITHSHYYGKTKDLYDEIS